MNTPCALCGASDSRLWLRKDAWRYLTCRTCSAVWLDPLPSDGWAEDFYDLPYFEGGGRGGYRDYLADETLHRKNARARVALAKRYGAAPPGLWIDVGCAAGFTLVEAREAGFRVRGVDISPWARAFAGKHFDLDVAASICETQRELAEKTSVVSMFQVLEHLPSPLAALQQARACMRPGGLLVVETWDRASMAARLFGKRWQQITPPSVAWLFDRQSLGYAMARAGFALRAIVPTSKAVSVGWACGLLIEKTPAQLSSLLSRLADGRLGKLSVNYRLGDLVTALATAVGPQGADDGLCDEASDQRTT